MTFFWILWGFDALISLVVLFFFFWGLADGSVSATNILLWLAMVGGVAAILLGSYFLSRHHQVGLAKSVLGILAFPGFMYLLMIISMLFIKDWR